jgi:glycosyltransferase involved in cell wall biosynthesis
MDDALERQVPPETEVIRVPGGSALSAWLRLRGGDSGKRSGRAFENLRKLSDWWLMPDSYAGWSRRAAALTAKRLERGDVDAVLSSSPPDSVHLAARSLRARFGLPWVADFRDPWIGLHFRTPPTQWHRARHARLERTVVTGADAVLAASETHARHLRTAFQPRNLVVLPNGYEPEPRETAAATPSSDTFRLVYTGTLSQMPDTETFLEALHELFARRPEARRRIRARLLGPFDSGYQDRAVALGLTGIVEFAGPRPHEESRELQRAADVLLLWKPHGIPSMVPGKLYEYLDSGRPILAVLDASDEAAALVRRGGGAITTPGDRAALAVAIEQRYLEWKERVAAGRPAAEPAARPEWLERHTRAGLAGELAQVLDRLQAEGP